MPISTAFSTGGSAEVRAWNAIRPDLQGFPENKCFLYQSVSVSLQLKL
jgi:hypothetical protein